MRARVYDHDVHKMDAHAIEIGSMSTVSNEAPRGAT
jgi:hypothetical protein